MRAKRVSPWLCAGASWLPLFALYACATPVDSPSSFPADRRNTQESLLESRRALVRAGYDDGPTTTVVDGVEVRVSDIDMADAVLRGRVARPRTEVRVPLQNPWRLHTDTKAHAAALDAQGAELDAEQTRLETRACLRGVDAQARQLEIELWERHRADMARVLGWLDALLDEKLISAASHEVESAAIQQRLLRARPDAPGESVALVALPALAAVSTRLDLGYDVLAHAVGSHPLWARAKAEHDHLTSLARRETSKRLPYLAWISMGYTPRYAQDRPILEGRFAVEIPLGLDAAGKANSLELRAAGALLDGEAQMLEQLDALRAALETWDAWEASIPELIAAQDAATEHRTTALAWIEARSARPSETASLLRDAYEIERSVHAARGRAGAASCHVQALGGVHPTAWPRTPR